MCTGPMATLFPSRRAPIGRCTKVVSQMNRYIRCAAMLTLLLTGGCMQTAPVPTVQVYDPVDSFQEYTQRADRVTLSAGNAQEVNTRIQEIDPWPRYVANKRIPANG